MCKSRVTVVIPSYAEATACFEVLKGLAGQTLPPVEVLLIMSGNWSESETYWSDWVYLFSLRNTVLRVFYVSARLMPGAARNVGLMSASGDWIAFLDVQTIPRKDWLERQLKLTKNLDMVGSYGATLYIATGAKSALVRDAIYGVLPVRTIPGAVLHKSVFKLVGQFIPILRAAEDTEWMIRAELMQLKIFNGHVEPSTDYIGLDGLGFIEISKKWRRNYVSCRDLQHLKVQRVLVALMAYVTVSLFALNWNALVAGWQMDSPYYIHHITKIVSLLPVVFYVLFRGLYIPLKRGARLRNLLPFRFLLLALVGASLDVIKISAFVVPMFREQPTAHGNPPVFRGDRK
jgi:glycosyltransferase involved in cell wall biosynthesis